MVTVASLHARRRIAGRRLTITSRLPGPLRQDARWNADRRRAGRHVTQHDCVRTNASVIPDANGSEHFCSRTDVDVTTDHGQPRAVTLTNRDVLENQAV